MNSLKTEKTRILQNSVEFCKIRAFSTTKNPAETKGSAGQIIGRNNRGCGIFTDSYRFRQQTTLGLSVGGDSACEILLVYAYQYSAEVQRITDHGVSQREEQSDDIR